MKPRLRRKLKRKKKRLRLPGTEDEDSLPRKEYLDLHKEKGGPSNPTAIPGTLRGVSVDEESTLAWIRMNCKFARNENESIVPQGSIRHPGSKVRKTQAS